MRKIIFRRLATAACCAAFMIIGLVMYVPGQNAGSGGQNAGSGNVKVSILPVIVMATGATVPSSGSSMSRNNHGVFFTLHTQGLPSGHAVTAWLAVFNRPDFCATDPCTPADFANPLVNGTLLNTGGQIIGQDGTATYGAFRAVGDTTGARPGVGTGNGLVDPKRAEIHIVVRDHGLAILGDPMVLAQQLTMFNGGCPPNTCMNLYASVHQP